MKFIIEYIKNDPAEAIGNIVVWGGMFFMIFLLAGILG